MFLNKNYPRKHNQRGEMMMDEVMQGKTPQKIHEHAGWQLAAAKGVPDKDVRVQPLKCMVAVRVGWASS